MCEGSDKTPGQVTAVKWDHSLGNQGGPELEKRRLQKDPWVQASPGRAQKYCCLAWGLSQRALPGVTLP